MEDKIEQALEKTHEWLLTFLEKQLPGTISSFQITLHVEYDEQGPIRIVIDVQASRPRAKAIADIVEEAVIGARRIFEKEAGIQASTQIRISSRQNWKRGSYSNTYKRGSRRRRSRHRNK